MKVIRGKMKRQLLEVPSGIRPAAMRLKTSLFDMIHEICPESVVLDLFAGSGALGFESLSCGAALCVLVDERDDCCAVVNRNAVHLKVTESVRVYCLEAVAAVKMLGEKNEQFDLVFLDPPYYSGILRKTLQAINEYDIVAKLGFIIVLCPRDKGISSVQEVDGFTLLKEKHYGQSAVFIYQKQE